MIAFPWRKRATRRWVVERSPEGFRCLIYDAGAEMLDRLTRRLDEVLMDEAMLGERFTITLPDGVDVRIVVTLEQVADS